MPDSGGPPRSLTPEGSRAINREAIRERRARRNRALRGAGGAIHVRRPDLVDAVEMHAGSLVAQLVVEGDDNGFADVGFHGRARPLPVDADHGAPEAVGVWVCPHPGHIPVVIDSLWLILWLWLCPSESR